MIDKSLTFKKGSCPSVIQTQLFFFVSYFIALASIDAYFDINIDPLYEINYKLHYMCSQAA